MDWFGNETFKYESVLLEVGATPASTGVRFGRPTADDPPASAAVVSARFLPSSRSPKLRRLLADLPFLCPCWVDQTRKKGSKKALVDGLDGGDLDG